MSTQVLVDTLVGVATELSLIHWHTVSYKIMAQSEILMFKKVVMVVIIPYVVAVLHSGVVVTHTQLMVVA